MRLVDVEERVASTDDALAAEEAFLCSTTREVMAVAAVEQHELAIDGAKTREARAALRAHIESELG